MPLPPQLPTRSLQGTIKVNIAHHLPIACRTPTPSPHTQSLPTHAMPSCPCAIIHSQLTKSEVRPGRLCSPGTSALVASASKKLSARHHQGQHRAPFAHHMHDTHTQPTCTIPAPSSHACPSLPPHTLTGNIERGEARQALQARYEWPCPLSLQPVVCKAPSRLATRTICSSHACHPHPAHMHNPCPLIPCLLVPTTSPTHC